MNITIYHNPRCRKSREALNYIIEKKINYILIKYLEEKFNNKTLSEVLIKLKLKPEELIRKNEKIWINKYKGKSFSDEKLIEILVENEKLIERPIITYKNDGVIGRPIENLVDFLKKINNP